MLRASRVFFARHKTLNDFVRAPTTLEEDRRSMLDENSRKHPWYKRALGLYNHKAMAQRYALRMYGRCAARWEYEEALRDDVLHSDHETDFYAWFQLTLLHVWMCLGRIETPKLPQADRLHQELIDAFFADIHDKLIEHGVTNPFSYGSVMKQLGRVYNGTCQAYDKGMAQGDTVLAEALWRNLLNGDDIAQDAHLVKLARLVSYVRRERVALHNGDHALLSHGYIRFGKYEEAIAHHEPKRYD